MLLCVKRTLYKLISRAWVTVSLERTLLVEKCTLWKFGKNGEKCREFWSVSFPKRSVHSAKFGWKGKLGRNFGAYASPRGAYTLQNGNYHSMVRKFGAYASTWGAYALKNFDTLGILADSTKRTLPTPEAYNFTPVPRKKIEIIRYQT